MLCPKCSSDDLKVLETRAGKVASTRRRRECLECGHRFSTIEEVLREDLAVVKRDGRRESFERTPNESMPTPTPMTKAMGKRLGNIAIRPSFNSLSITIMKSVTNKKAVPKLIARSESMTLTSRHVQMCNCIL